MSRTRTLENKQKDLGFLQIENPKLENRTNRKLRIWEEPGGPGRNVGEPDGTALGEPIGATAIAPPLDTELEPLKPRGLNEYLYLF